MKAHPTPDKLKKALKVMLLALLIIPFSCSDNVDRFQGVCLLTKTTTLSGFESFVRQWEYSSNNRIAKLSTGYEGATPVVHTYSYNNTTATITDTQGNIWVYTFDNNFNLVSIVHDPDGENSTHTFEYTDGQITMVLENNTPGLEYTVTSVFTLDGAGVNIANEYTKVEEDGVVTQEYERDFQYSSGINPYSMLMFPGVGEVPALFSQNTVTKIVTTDLMDDTNETVNYTYTYDSNQLPLTIDGGRITFEYDCR